MTAIFGGKSNLIHVQLFYKVVETNGAQRVVILEDDDAKKRKANEEEGIEVLNTKWKPQTWTINLDIMNKSYAYNPANSEKEFDFIRFQENILNDCLVEWDAVDDEGKPVPCDRENIGQLILPIARALLDKYQTIIGSSEEDSKK